MQTYLVQRGKFDDRPHKKGIDSIVSLDYMGASEYEWGALPKSLDIIRRDISDYQYTDLMVKGRSVTIFCPSRCVVELPEYLNTIAEGKMRMKCGSYFDAVFSDDHYFKDKFNFWWDIENHLMFWLTNLDFEEKFKLIIPHTPE